MSTRVRKPQRGRPIGALSFDAEVASVVGSVIRELRLAAGVSQENLAHMANVERSYCGRIERGESQPTLFVILKVAAALEMEGHALVRQVENALVRKQLGGTAKGRRADR
ncbi:helix-turn-helix domain-containing protein [Sphaerotilaceae bacterium SBD11-9]